MRDLQITYNIKKIKLNSMIWFVLFFLTFFGFKKQCGYRILIPISQNDYWVKKKILKFNYPEQLIK